MSQTPQPTAAGAPRWFLLLPLLAIAAWWPWSPYWQSDDFIAVSVSRDVGRVLGDFVGPQYGATDLWLFYRPLITASLWLEQLIAGSSPMLSHVTNVLAHAASTLLVALVWRRFLGDAGGFVAAAVWSLMPSHVGSIVWTVGRVDSHTTVWIVMAVWLVLRGQEDRAAGRRASAWPAALATIAACLSKELAVLVPPLATLAALPRAPAGPFAQRLRAAVLAARGPWLVIAAYAPWRWYVVGGVGGYAGAVYDPAAMLGGAVKAVGYLGVPLAWIGLPADPPLLPAPAWLAAAALPPALAVLLALRRARRLVLTAFAGFLLSLAPIAAFLASVDNPQTMRLYYVPAILLAGVVAAAGRGAAIVVLLAWAWPFVAARADWYRADQHTRALHAALLQTAANGAADPMFVAGLPQTNASRVAVQMMFGVDRLLQPPFGDVRTLVYPLRPALPSHTAFRLYPEGELPFALPAGSTWFVDAAITLQPAPAPRELPLLEVAGYDDGVVDLTSQRLDEMAAAGPDAPIGLRFPGVRSPLFRVTLFTSSGYFATLCKDHAPPGASDGEVRFYAWFAGDPRIESPPAMSAPGAYIGDSMQVPASLDLVPEFPTLIEAGTGQGVEFIPTHRARRLLRFRFDRGYTAWVRRVQGT